MTILSNKMIKKYALPAIATLILCIVVYLFLQSSPQKDSGSPVQEQFSGPGKLLRKILKKIRDFFPTKQASPEEPPQESREDSLKVETSL
uniref:Uncharacterized protein n=1 Tax=viral metagenome TaxID=1070528 RepID=A0A6C0FC19_9ZZZZ|tara:strand:+ start:5902 stop:6171 length:270 start_codon:yes stop_codon:yes gene_type:complete